jgi:malate dehydrogenase (oxaloacetate-decarboxylating)(NADP+)
MGSAKPAHVLTSAATVRRVFNMTALACVEAQIRDQVNAALEAEAARMGD